MRDRRTRSAGFTLLELLAATLIFALMASMVLVNLDRSTDKALASIRARELRLLAERKLGDVEIFQLEYDDIFDNEDLGKEYGERWDGWEWSLYIRDVVVFGETSDEGAEYLFGAPDEDDEDDRSTDGSGTGNEQNGDTQFLRELTLTVRAPRGDEAIGADDSVSLVTFLPIVERPTGGAGAGTGGGGGGQ